MIKKFLNFGLAAIMLFNSAMPVMAMEDKIENVAEISNSFKRTYITETENEITNEACNYYIILKEDLEGYIIDEKNEITLEGYEADCSTKLIGNMFLRNKEDKSSSADIPYASYVPTYKDGELVDTDIYAIVAFLGKDGTRQVMSEETIWTEPMLVPEYYISYIDYKLIDYIDFGLYNYLGEKIEVATAYEESPHRINGDYTCDYDFLDRNYIVFEFINHFTGETEKVAKMIQVAKVLPVIEEPESITETPETSVDDEITDKPDISTSELEISPEPEITIVLEPEITEERVIPPYLFAAPPAGLLLLLLLFRRKVKIHGALVDEANQPFLICGIGDKNNKFETIQDIANRTKDFEEYKTELFASKYYTKLPRRTKVFISDNSTDIQESVKLNEKKIFEAIQRYSGKSFTMSFVYKDYKVDVHYNF